MPDFKLTAAITITEAKIQAKALSKLKNMKISLDSRSINRAAKASKMLSTTLLSTKKTASKLNRQIMDMKRSAGSVRRTDSAVKKLGKTMKQAVRGGKDMTDMFEEIGRRALAFRVAATFINAFTDSISDAAQFLREFDQILADIAKISGQTSSELEVVGSKLLMTAADLGTVAEETAGQFRIFVQAGFDVSTSLEFAQKSMEGFNATTLEANQASEIFIQTMKVFGASEADKIFDKLAVAESSAAVTAKDLQEGMKRSAATFKAVGAGLDDMIGLLSAFQEASRRGGAVGGTAFRTILTRLTAGDTAEAVKKLGVEVANTNGDMRNIVTVIEELAVRFQSLTEEQRVQAATTIAGRRQFESFLIILDTIGRAQGIAAKTTDSVGEATKRSAIQAETLNGKIETLRNTFLKMVTGMEEFIPIRDIFSNMLTVVTKLTDAFGGTVGKLTAMAALIVGFKSLGPVLKGLGKLTAGVGGAFPALMAGGFGFAPGGFGIGKGKTKTEFRPGKFGQTIEKTTTSSKLGGAQQKIAGTKALNIASLALGVTLAGLTSTIKDTDDQTIQWKEQLVSMGSAIAVAFAFGPVLGGLTALGMGLMTIKGAIDDNIERNHAYRMSLIKFGSETLAGMEAALIDAKSAGDAHTVAILQNAIAFEKATKMLEKNPGQMVDVVHNIQDVLDKLETFAPGQEVGKNFRNDIVSAFEKAGLKPQEITQLMGDPETFRKILADVGFTIKGSGSVWDEFQRQVNEDLVNMKKLPTLIDLDSVFDADFQRGQTQFRNAMQEAELANQIFIKGITDVNEIRKLESAIAIKSADSVVAKEKEIFRAMLGDFSELSSLDFKEVLGAFEGVFGEDVRSAPSAQKGVEQLADIFDLNLSSVEGVEKELTKLVEVYMNVQKGSLDYRQELLKNAQVLTEINFDILTKSQTKLREERERELSVVESLQNAIRGLSIEGGVGGVPQAFDALNSALSDGATTDELFQLLGVTEALENPIAQARRALETNHQANLDNIASMQKHIDLIDASIEAYAAAEPSQERNAKLKELEGQKLNALAEQEKARGKTLADAEQDIKKVRVTEKKAMDDLAKAEQKLIESQNELASSLLELQDNFNEMSDSQHADAQERLKESQIAVMDSTSELADAYNNLMEAQLELGDAISDYRVGVGLAAMQVDIITGNIRGFSEKMRALEDVYDNAINSLNDYSGRVISLTNITEEQRLALLRESAQKQLDLVQSVLDETLSIGQKFFTTDAGDQAGLTRGFAALQNVAGQFTAAGGFGGVDLNELGNSLLNLPQALREEMVNALSNLPSTATIGGLTKDELESILFGAAVGESEEAGIEHIAELTDLQVELIKQIAELDMAGVLTAEAGLEEARKQTELAENQLLIDEFALQQAEQNVAEVRSEIQKASSILADVQQTGNAMLSENITMSSLENLNKRQAEHLARLASLQSIDLNISNLAGTMNKVSDALSGAVAAGSVLGAYGGHIPKNFAKGNMFSGLIKAYSREKRMGPPGSNPVIANDTEMIIPTKSRGHVPNYQGGNVGSKIFDTTDIERLLQGILEAVIQPTEAGATGAPVTQKVEANINVNAEQRVRIEGATSVADAVAQSVRSALNDQVSQDQLSSIENTILEFFNVLKSKGLVNAFGQG